MLDLRRRFMMSASEKVDVRKLVFSYTGTWTDTEMEINGQLYRVLQLKSNGTLTFDEQMVKKNIPFDVWGVGKGADGDYYNHTFGTGSYYVSTTTYTCPNCGTRHACERTDYYGDSGSPSGWAFKYGATTKSLTAVATMTNVASASLGNIFTMSGDYTREGSAWFSVSSYGAGGNRGSEYYVEGYSCSCGHSYGANSGSLSAAGSGSNGIVVIRLLIEE